MASGLKSAIMEILDSRGNSAATVNNIILLRATQYFYLDVTKKIITLNRTMLYSILYIRLDILLENYYLVLSIRDLYRVKTFTDLVKPSRQLSSLCYNKNPLTFSTKRSMALSLPCLASTSRLQ